MGKVLPQDLCDNSQSLKKESVVFCNDISTPHSETKECVCHCHHGHFDLIFFGNIFNQKISKSNYFAFNYISPKPLHVLSLERPPKIES